MTGGIVTVLALLSRFPRTVLAAIVGSVIVSFVPHTMQAQVVPGATFDHAATQDGNYDKAEFRLWYPKNVAFFRGVIVLVPGASEDGRSMVEDSVWRAFAIRHHFALIGCHFTLKKKPQIYDEMYSDAAKGSGQALLNALNAFAKRAKYPELASAPLLLWGISAGGQFNYEFVAWKPERVIAFVVNKGGFYYSALVPRAARQVPGMLFVGKKDDEFRTNIIVGLFSVNRRIGARWSLVEEPNVGHDFEGSHDMAAIFFEDILALRLDSASVKGKVARPLRSVHEDSGYIGNLKTKTYRPRTEVKELDYLTAWLPTERVARAWAKVVTDTVSASSKGR